MTVIYEKTGGINIPTFDVMIDIDDVMMPWFETVDRHCIEAWGYDGSIGKCDSWAMNEFYGKTREEWEDVVARAAITGLYTSTDPFPGAADAVNELLWRGHRVHFVTARGFMSDSSEIKVWTKEWLDTYSIGYTTLSFQKDKVCAMHGLGVRFDFAVDDAVHNYEDLRNIKIPTWLHDAPHNQSYDCKDRIFSVVQFAKMVHVSQSVTATLVNS